nr:RNA-dependent RNA polymerase [Flumine noda-like virus 40]
MPPSNPLYVFVDVDQYMDMPSFLCDNVAPTLIYTFQPEQVAKVSTEYSYTFNAKNEVEYRVTGAGLYTHEIWNYGHDNVLVTKTFCGIPYKCASYGMDKRKTAPDHEIICLTPLKSWTGIFAIWTCWTLRGNSLARLRVVNGKYLRLMLSCMDGGLQVSTGKVGDYAQATVSAIVDNTLATIAETSKYDITLPQVASYIDGDKVAGAVLLDYHRSRITTKPDVVCPVSEAVRTYHFSPSTYVNTMKPLVEAYMCPILGDCFVPSDSLESEQVAVLERVNKVKPPELPMTPFIAKMMHEFVEHLIPYANQLDPVDFDEVIERQSRPTQRVILEQSQYINQVKRVVQSFLKREPYGEVKAPRVISTINGSDKAAYSRYIYAFAEHVLKPQDWYAFGKIPKDIARRVAAVCQSAKNNASNSDFSKFDGHGSNLMRELERMALVRAFRLEHTQTVLELHRSQYSLKAFTTRGVAYDTEYTRLSGSPETATFNGTINAFVSYIQARMARPDGSELSPAEAWNSLGIYGGDDGLTADVCPETYVKAAKLIGQVLTVDCIPRGSLGVTFLARVYSPYVWEGDVNTCCDLPRQLAKLHVTPRLPASVTPVQKLLEKCRAYWLTDRYTPILGEFVERARELLGKDFESDPACLGIRPWGSDIPIEVQYVNHPADWLEAYAVSVLPDADFLRFRSWLRECVNVVNLLSPPLLRSPSDAKPSLPVVVDGEEHPRKPLVSSSKAPKVVQREETFEEMKARKVKAGTWVDVNPKEHKNKSWKPSGRSPRLSK